MKKLGLKIVCIFCIGAALISCADRKATKFAAIKSEKKLILGTSADYPPYEFHIQKDGKDEITGFDIEIARVIAKDLGAELVIRDMDFDGLLAALVSGSVDMVLAGMTPTDERKQNVDFSEIYYTAEHGIIIRKADADKYGSSVTSLTNTLMGAQRGSIQVGIAKQQIKGVSGTGIDKPHPQIKELPKLPDLIMELKSGKIDAVIVEAPVAENYIAVHKDLMLADYTFQDLEGGSAVAVKKGETELLAAVNKSIGALKASGKINRFVAEAIESVEQ
ncbi:MAG: transporter substrate-binding domain-containing protein [Treponema sp.]